MSELQATIVFLALFALRCVLPLVLTVVIGTLMNRMLARWEEQDKAASTPPVTPKPAAQPALRRSLACWVFQNCEASDCPAYSNRSAPCWQLRAQGEGQLPAECIDCDIYTDAVPAL